MSKVDDAIHSLTHLAKHSNVTVVRDECAQAADVMRELAARVAEQDKIIERGQKQIDGIYDSVLDTLDALVEKVAAEQNGQDEVDEFDDRLTTLRDVEIALYGALGIKTRQ